MDKWKHCILVLVRIELWWQASLQLEQHYQHFICWDLVIHVLGFTAYNMVLWFTTPSVNWLFYWIWCMTTALLCRIEQCCLFPVYFSKTCIIWDPCHCYAGFVSLCGWFLMCHSVLQAVFSASPPPSSWSKLKLGTRNDMGTFGLNSYALRRWTSFVVQLLRMDQPQMCNLLQALKVVSQLCC